MENANNAIATAQNITVGTRLFFARCYDDEGGYCHITSATVSTVEQVAYADYGIEGLRFWLRDDRGDYEGEGYANQNGSVINCWGEGAAYLTREAVPSVNESSEPDDEDQG